MEPTEGGGKGGRSSPTAPLSDPHVLDFVMPPPSARDAPTLVLSSVLYVSTIVIYAFV